MAIRSIDSKLAVGASAAGLAEVAIPVYRYDRQGFAQLHGHLKLMLGSLRIGSMIVIEEVRFEVLSFWDVKSGVHPGLVPIYHYDEARLAALMA